MWTDIARDIAAASGEPFTVVSHARVGGGCINAGHRVTGARRSYFVKTSSADGRDMFAAEAAALTALAQTGAVRVPQAICAGGSETASWLVLEHLELQPLTPSGALALGAQLAALHRHTAKRYGWPRDNTIGRTPQANAWCADWVQFWREQRLRPQYALALKNGHGGRLQRDGEKLMERSDRFYAGYTPAASLLHGDLWSGNAASEARGSPVIYDPASYYGDRETDLAMTELFGGYPADFHAAYRAHYPLDAGYEVRRTLYNLYHVLNHLNLFGGSYLRQAETMTARLLALV